MPARTLLRRQERGCSLAEAEQGCALLAGLVLLQDLRVPNRLGRLACPQGRSEAPQEALLWRRRCLCLGCRPGLFQVCCSLLRSVGRCSGSHATFLLALLRGLRIELHILLHATRFVYSASVRLTLDVSVTWLKKASSTARSTRPISGMCRQRPGAAGFEDGTPAYLGIAALKHGFAQIERFGSFAAIERHTASLTRCCS